MITRMHIDVYKRQAVAMSKGDIVMFLSQDALPSDEHYVETMLAGFENEEVVMISARPVSYTHLDVYKRQVQKQW